MILLEKITDIFTGKSRKTRQRKTEIINIIHEEIKHIGGNDLVIDFISEIMRYIKEEEYISKPDALYNVLAGSVRYMNQTIKDSEDIDVIADRYFNVIHPLLMLSNKPIMDKMESGQRPTEQDFKVSKDISHVMDQFSQFINRELEQKYPDFNDRIEEEKKAIENALNMD